MKNCLLRLLTHVARELNGKTILRNSIQDISPSSRLFRSHDTYSFFSAIANHALQPVNSPFNSDQNPREIQRFLQNSINKEPTAQAATLEYSHKNNSSCSNKIQEGSINLLHCGQHVVNQIPWPQRPRMSSQRNTQCSKPYGKS